MHVPSAHIQLAGHGRRSCLKEKEREGFPMDVVVKVKTCKLVRYCNRSNEGGAMSDVDDWEWRSPRALGPFSGKSRK